MSRSYTSSPPQVPPWHLAGLLYLFFTFYHGIGSLKIFKELSTLPMLSIIIILSEWVTKKIIISYCAILKINTTILEASKILNFVTNLREKILYIQGQLLQQ
jgi:hypothetical protein